MCSPHIPFISWQSNQIDTKDVSHQPESIRDGKMELFCATLLLSHQSGPVIERMNKTYFSVWILHKKSRREPKKKIHPTDVQWHQQKLCMWSWRRKKKIMQTLDTRNSVCRAQNCTIQTKRLMVRRSNKKTYTANLWFQLDYCGLFCLPICILHTRRWCGLFTTFACCCLCCCCCCFFWKQYILFARICRRMNLLLFALCYRYAYP